MGDRQATSPSEWLRSVVARYEGSLVRYAARLTGDAERAHDVVQDTFLRLCQQDRTKIDGHLTAWLFQVCRHRALDVLRKEKRMHAIAPEQLEERVAGGDSCDAAERHDEHQAVLELLAALPENQQEVVRLKFQNGLSYREISDVTGLSVSNIGYLLHTALKQIRRRLTVECDCETSKQKTPASGDV